MAEIMTSVDGVFAGSIFCCNPVGAIESALYYT